MTRLSSSRRANSNALESTAAVSGLDFTSVSAAGGRIISDELVSSRLKLLEISALIMFKVGEGIDEDVGRVEIG